MVAGCRPQSSPTDRISRFRLRRREANFRSRREPPPSPHPTWPFSAASLYLRILLRVSLMCGNFSLNVSFMSFFRSEGLTYSMTVVCDNGKESVGFGFHVPHFAATGGPPIATHAAQQPS